MTEENHDNMTTLAVAIGRVETLTQGISQQLSEFKANHARDIDIIWVEVNRLKDRTTSLENINLERKGGKISLRTIIEIIVGASTLYLYYLMAMHK